jgi:hypothetical protein
MDKKPTFPIGIEEKAFHLRQEYAWQKEDLETVFDYCLKANIAILGGEAWVVRRITDLTPDEPFERNLDSRYRQDVSILSRTKTHVIYGIFPYQDGSNGVFAWDTHSRKDSQSWHDYVNMTVNESIDIIRRGNVERHVVQKYSDNIYYNLVFNPQENTS